MLEDLPTLWKSHCIIGHHRFHTLLANTCAGALSCDASGNEYTFPRQRNVYEPDDHFFTPHV